MERKIKIILGFIILLFILGLFGFIKLFSELSELSTDLPQRIDFPNDYKTLFNPKELPKIKHLYTESYSNKKAFPISAIEIDTSFIIDIFKYVDNGSSLRKIKIEDNCSATSRFFLKYISFSSLNLSMGYRHDLSNIIDTIYIRSTYPIDTLVFNNNVIILKGKLGKLEIKIDGSRRKADQYIVNEYPIFNGDIKYYLVWINKNGFIYELFIEAKKFDDKRMMELFDT